MGNSLWQFLARGVAVFSVPDTNPEVATEEAALAAEERARAAMAALSSAEAGPVIVCGDNVDDGDDLAPTNRFVCARGLRPPGTHVSLVPEVVDDGSTGAGLAHRQGTQVLAGYQLRQEPLLLFVGSPASDLIDAQI